MAYNIKDSSYAQAVSSLGGYFDSKGAATTQNTWGTEAVDTSKWQSGGWYTNPTTGKVEQWWSGSQAQATPATTSATPTTSTSTGTANVSLSQQPTIDLASEYKSLYESLGISALKESVATTQQAILALRSTADEQIAKVNENPWFSAATMSGRIAKIENQYNSKASVLSAQATLEQQKYTDAVSELNNQLSLKTQQYQYDVTNYQNNLTQLNTLLDMGALDNASLSSLETIASQTGMSTEMIQSMITATKAKNVNPTLIQNTDDSGNVTVTLIDANTGNVINQTSLGAVSGSSTSKSSSTSSTQEKADTLAYLDDAMAGLSQANLEWAQDQGWQTTGFSYIWPDQWKQAFYDWQSQTGGSYSQFKNRYSRYIDPNQADLYDLGV